MKCSIRNCPESIRYIPWLANRVKFHNELLTSEEFDGKYTINDFICTLLRVDLLKVMSSDQDLYDS
jgi:hypothetical protein